MTKSPITQIILMEHMLQERDNEIERLRMVWSARDREIAELRNMITTATSRLAVSQAHVSVLMGVLKDYDGDCGNDFEDGTPPSEAWERRMLHAVDMVNLPADSVAEDDMVQTRDGEAAWKAMQHRILTSNGDGK